MKIRKFGKNWFFCRKEVTNFYKQGELVKRREVDTTAKNFMGLSDTPNKLISEKSKPKIEYFGEEAEKHKQRLIERQKRREEEKRLAEEQRKLQEEALAKKDDGQELEPGFNLKIISQTKSLLVDVEFHATDANSTTLLVSNLKIGGKGTEQIIHFGYDKLKEFDGFCVKVMAEDEKSKQKHEGKRFVEFFWFLHFRPGDCTQRSESDWPLRDSVHHYWLPGVHCGEGSISFSSKIFHWGQFEEKTDDCFIILTSGMLLNEVGFFNNFWIFLEKIEGKAVGNMREGWLLSN